jgi:DNA-binding MarR family transcriptional regulator
VKSRDQTASELAFQMFEISKHTWLRSQREKFKGGYDLSESEFLALDALQRVPCLSVGDLRRQVGVLPAQMSRIIKALEQRYEEKLVLCAINAHDKRKIDVSITPKGRRAVDAYRRAKIQATVNLLQTLSPHELECLTEILGKIGPASAKAGPMPHA